MTLPTVGWIMIHCWIVKNTAPSIFSELLASGVSKIKYLKHNIIKNETFHMCVLNSCFTKCFFRTIWKSYQNHSCKSTPFMNNFTKLNSGYINYLRKIYQCRCYTFNLKINKHPPTPAKKNPHHSVFALRGKQIVLQKIVFNKGMNKA